MKQIIGYGRLKPIGLRLSGLISAETQRPRGSFGPASDVTRRRHRCIAVG
jgi:hypothetical protein